jgi:hypothetical protein
VTPSALMPGASSGSSATLLHLLAIDEDARRKGAERVAIGFGGDQHGGVSSLLPFECLPKI